LRRSIISTLCLTLNVGKLFWYFHCSNLILAQLVPVCLTNGSTLSSACGHNTGLTLTAMPSSGARTSSTLTSAVLVTSWTPVSCTRH
jgi:hypothetical protein